MQLLGAWLRYFSTFVQNQQGKFALAMIGQVNSHLHSILLQRTYRVNLT